MATRYWFIDVGSLIVMILAMLATQGGAGQDAAPVVIDDERAGVIEEMRQDLGERIGVDVAEVELTEFVEVTWPDACLGVYEAGRVCAQVLTPGFIARFAVGDDAYRYHGGDSRFVAVSFLEDVRVGEPVPGVKSGGIEGIDP